MSTRFEAEHEALIKTAIDRIRRDADEIVELKRQVAELGKYKEASELVIKLIADGKLDPLNGDKKIAKMVAAENFDLEKRATLLEIDFAVKQESFGELKDLSIKTGSLDPENTSPAGKLMQSLREINGVSIPE